MGHHPGHLNLVRRAKKRKRRPDHRRQGDVITLDFINTDLDPGARAGIELALETAKAARRSRPSDCRRRI
jgi:hypothetical protein